MSEFDEWLEDEKARAADLEQAVHDTFKRHLPDDNPKTAFGTQKDPMHFTPTEALRAVGRVMRGGAEKYGAYNWREDRITASTYYDAAMRHLMAWWDGEDLDPESGEPHLAHVMACCAILLDGREQDTLNDDRPEAPLPHDNLTVR